MPEHSIWIPSRQATTNLSIPAQQKRLPIHPVVQRAPPPPVSPVEAPVFPTVRRRPFRFPTLKRQKGPAVPPRPVPDRPPPLITLVVPPETRLMGEDEKAECIARYESIHADLSDRLQQFPLRVEIPRLLLERRAIEQELDETDQILRQLRMKYVFVSCEPPPE
jgi:hypothetical protein